MASGSNSRRYRFMTERLRRLERMYVDNPTYFITCCTENRKALLATPDIHCRFIEFSRGALERNVFVGRYVLMPDHVHLFVKMPPPSENLSKWIKSLKNFLSKSFNQSGHDAPHWQKGFYDHVLRSGESYSKNWMYVVENPVRAKLVTQWQQWPYQGEINSLMFQRE